MLIFFSPNKTDLSSSYTELFRIQHCGDFSDWEKSKTIPSAFVIDSKDAQYVNTIVNKIRRDHLAFGILCFVTEIQPSFDHQLLDGQLPEPSILKKRINDFVDLSESFKNSETYITPQGRLIKYLWLRPEFVIQPQKDWQHSRYYRYSLLDALSEDTVDSFVWLRQ